MPKVLANGVNIYYEIRGVGEPLLLIQGLTIDISQVESFIRELSQEFKVIAFDNRGAGRSDKPDAPYSIEMMAEDAAQLLNVLGISQVHVLGVSMGGKIALALSLEHPSNVKSLILVSTSAKSAFSKSLRWRLINVLFRVPGLMTLRDKYPQPRYAYYRQREASSSYDATERLHEIRVPTLILHGRRDRFAPYELAEETHKGIAGSQIVAFEGGHLLMFSRQKDLLISVLSFVKSQSGLDRWH